VTEVAIRVENLSKQYRIGKRGRYRTLRDTLADALRAPLRAYIANISHSCAGRRYRDTFGKGPLFYFR